VQDRAPQGRGARDLREFEAQAKTGLDFKFQILNLKFPIAIVTGIRAEARLQPGPEI
jgi:hypothetical protein